MFDTLMSVTNLTMRNYKLLNEKECHLGTVFNEYTRRLIGENHARNISATPNSEIIIKNLEYKNIASTI